MNDSGVLTYLLQQSQKHLQFGTWQINSSMDNFFISDELSAMFHLDKSQSYSIEVLGEVIYEDDLNAILELFEKAASLGAPFDSTFRSELNGELKYFSIFTDVEYKDGKVSFLYGFIQDISEYAIEEEKREKLLQLTEDYIIISQTNLKGEITYASQAFANICGYSKSELIGNMHNIIRHPDMQSDVFKELWETISSGNTWEGEVKNLKKDGGYYWVYSYITPLKNHKDKIIGYQSVRQDITDKKYIEKISITDGLTLLYNRRHFNTVLAKEINYSRRTNGRLIFAMLDIDNFKKYNDTYGHQKGDSVLVDVAHALVNSFKRSHDMVFRLGGEEFGILFSLKDGDDIFSLVDKARQNIQDLNIAHKLNGAGVITASFGVIEIKSDYTKKVEEEMKLAYKEADQFLYEAKARGRNIVCVKPD